MTLNPTDMPVHAHTLMARPVTAADYSAGPTESLARPDPATNLAYQANISQTPQFTSLNPGATTPTGGSQPHINQQPYLGVTFIIALQGIFPQRG